MYHPAARTSWFDLVALSVSRNCVKLPRIRYSVLVACHNMQHAADRVVASIQIGRNVCELEAGVLEFEKISDFS
jgi:hypothetical protein